MAPVPQSRVDWSLLPPDVLSIIMDKYEAHRAAMRIQAVWRGRDVRDFLDFPSSLALSPHHPNYNARCHLRRCPTCLNDEVRIYMHKRGMFRTPRAIFAWAQREVYLELYNPQWSAPLERTCKPMAD